MSEVVLPLLATLVVWWAGTALILQLDNLPATTFKWSFAAFSVLLLLALWGLHLSSDITSPAGAWTAFGCGVAVWAWHEVTFLLGYITGPRVSSLPARSGPWRRFACAVATILYHEFALLLSGLLVYVLTAGGANKTGLWTFLILWVMRLSAKLNLFLGVRNLGREFLPPHMRYLGTYFERRRMNLLFPVSVAASTLAAVLLWRAVGVASGFEAVSLVFAASLLSLGVVEHLFMVLPFDYQALWQSRSARIAAAAASGTAFRA